MSHGPTRILLTLSIVCMVGLLACTPPVVPTPVAQDGQVIVVQTPTSVASELTQVGKVAPPVATATPTIAPSPTKVPVKLAQDQTIRLIGVDVDTIDPQVAENTNEIDTITRVYEGLMNFNDKLEVIPAQAERYTLSPDGKTYTFVLRAGLKYSDGTPLTASNFVYGWKRLCDPAVPVSYSFASYHIAGCEAYSAFDPKKQPPEEHQAQYDKIGVKALDDRTLQFELTEPAPYFASMTALWFGAPVREDLIKQGGDQWSSDPNGKYYIGNGPFIMKEFKPRQHRLFVPNPNYRLGPPRVSFDIKIVNEGSIWMAAYRNNEIDAMVVSPQEVPIAENDPVLSKEVIHQPGVCTLFYGFNTTKAPFNNPKVRQAFAQAVNRDSLVNGVFQGIGKPAYSLIPPGIPGYDPSIKTWEFNPVAARRTLAEAGYPDGKGLPDITFSYAPTDRNKVMSAFLQAQLHDNLGVDIKLESLEGKVFSSEMSKLERTPQIFRGGWCMDYPDPQDFISTLFDSRTTAILHGWKNDEVDQLVRAADVEQNWQKRLPLYKRAQEIVVREAPVVFVYYTENILLVKPYILGYKPVPGDYYMGDFGGVMNLAVAEH